MSLHWSLIPGTYTIEYTFDVVFFDNNSGTYVPHPTLTAAIGTTTLILEINCPGMSVDYTFDTYTATYPDPNFAIFSTPKPAPILLPDPGCGTFLVEETITVTDTVTALSTIPWVSDGATDISLTSALEVPSQT